jgi:hypothetical protein
MNFKIKKINPTDRPYFFFQQVTVNTHFFFFFFFFWPEEKLKPMLITRGSQFVHRNYENPFSPP